jgi:hypothetical protein
MEVYDPAFQHGAIKIARECNDQCLLVKTLGYHENIAIIKIWKLQLRPEVLLERNKREKEIKENHVVVDINVC